MKHDDQSFGTFLHVLRRHARVALLAAFAVLFVMTCVVFAMPAIYESSASLQIVQPEVAPDTLGATTSREYVEQRLQRARQRVLTLANFEKGLRESSDDIAPSAIYAYACLRSGVPYANGAPNLSVDFPAM